METVKVNNRWTDLQSWPVARITKNFIVAQVNDVATINYRRKDGNRTGDVWIGEKIPTDELQRLNALADANGGTWKPGKGN